MDFGSIYLFLCCLLHKMKTKVSWYYLKTLYVSCISYNTCVCGL